VVLQETLHLLFLLRVDHLRREPLRLRLPSSEARLDLGRMKANAHVGRGPHRSLGTLAAGVDHFVELLLSRLGRLPDLRFLRGDDLVVPITLAPEISLELRGEFFDRPGDEFDLTGRGGGSFRLPQKNAAEERIFTLEPLFLLLATPLLVLVEDLLDLFTREARPHEFRVIPLALGRLALVLVVVQGPPDELCVVETEAFRSGRPCARGSNEIETSILRPPKTRVGLEGISLREDDRVARPPVDLRHFPNHLLDGRLRGFGEELVKFPQPTPATREDIFPVDKEHAVGKKGAMESPGTLLPTVAVRDADRLELMVIQGLEDEPNPIDLRADADETTEKEGLDVPIDLGIDLGIFRGFDTDLVRVLRGLFAFDDPLDGLPNVRVIRRPRRAVGHVGLRSHPRWRTVPRVDTATGWSVDHTRRGNRIGA
jgi:hypothetical protein